MKKNINIFNKELKKEFETQIQDIVELKEKTKEYIEKIKEEKEESLQQENNKYEEIVNTMKEIRDKKKEEIDRQIVISQNKIKKLNNKYQTLAKNYCKEHGHLVAFIDYKFKHYTGQHSIYGDEGFYEFITKCLICGKVASHYDTYYGNKPKTDNYMIMIPYDLKPEHQEIQEQINALEEYISYLEYLKTKICKIFGHDVDLTNAKIYYSSYNALPIYREYGFKYYTCEYCGKHLDEVEDWINYDLLYHYGIVIPDSEKDLSLPSFEDYQRKLKK